MKTKKITEPILMVDSRHGIYMPQILIQELTETILNQIPNDIKTVLLAGPDNEIYWDCMNELLNKTFIFEDDEFYFMYNEDLWFVPMSFEIEDWII